ncbi:MAG: hypothetical protein K2K53_10795 [Oscillospiraceae bacterium]|nr:hypothetical protein [Oscillospiraceae bacterium]
MEKKNYKSWTISDAFWEAIKDEIPEWQRAEGKLISVNPVEGESHYPNDGIRGNILGITDGLPK